MTLLEYIVKANLKHNNRYKYSLVVYINNKTKIKIICNTHGIFEQRPDKHLQGNNCPKCSGKYNYTNSEYIIQANLIHNNKYNYWLIEYKNNHTKIKIHCEIHGIFEQKPNNHLQGQGCSKCGNESHWKRSDYIKKAKNRICKFYVLRCYNENEIFYKIGITMNSVKQRYRDNNEMPYNYEIINEIKGDAGTIWDLELAEKRRLKEYKYNPYISFDGSKTECFTQIK